MSFRFVSEERVLWIEGGSYDELAERLMHAFRSTYATYYAVAIALEPDGPAWVSDRYEIGPLVDGLDRLPAPRRGVELSTWLQRQQIAERAHPGERRSGPAIAGDRSGVWVWVDEPVAARPSAPPEPPQEPASRPPASRPEPLPAPAPAPASRSSRLRDVWAYLTRQGWGHPKPSPTRRRKPEPGEPGTPVPGGSQLLTRTPHLATDETATLAPGDAFSFSVWCDDEAPAEGEAVVPVTIEAPVSQRRFPLAVWIAASPHFRVDDPTGMLIIDRDEPRSDALRFDARVANDPPPGDGTLTAVFDFGGRPSGRVTRTLGIGGAAAREELPALPPPPTDTDHDAPPPPPPRVVARTGLQRADITVEVKALDTQGRAFACRVLTPARAGVPPVTWSIPQGLPAAVAAYMEDFTTAGMSDDERRSKLVGAGISLWEEAPTAFKEAFWDLAPELRSIQVVSDDWSFPWELLVPVRGRGPGREQLEPLGVAYQVGRWVTDTMISPPQEIPLVDSYAVAPWYQPPDELVNAPAEAAYVCANFHGELIDPGDFTSIEGSFGRRGVSLIHLVCHGEAPVGRSQVVRLHGGGRLLSHQLAGMAALSKAVRETEPFVFLNACEVGRGDPVMIGTGGFATAFIDLGARAVIAPLWTVDDAVAYEYATTFYDAILQQPGTPLGEIMRGLRARAYADDGADTWAAYCLYSDPLARAAIPH